MNALSNLLGREGFLPHGYCFTWEPTLLWTMVVSDAFIAAAYFSIPMALLFFIRRRKDVSLRNVALLFSLFIFSCGATHAIDIWTVWQPVYDLQAATKVTTAASSVVTAVVMWLLMPKALAIPSARQLNDVIADKQREIIERIRIEDSLLDAQNNLAITLASLEAGIISVDKEGCVAHMNAVAERVTGLSLQAARGQLFWQVWKREGRPKELASRNPIDVALERGRGPSDVERLVVVSTNGVRTAVEASASPTRSPDGSLRGLVLVFRDMTRLDQADNESRRLAAIVESSSEAIIGKSLDGTVTSWNRAAEVLFGHSAEQMIGMSIQTLVPLDAQAHEARQLARLLAGELVAPFETRGLHRDGTVLNLSATISPIKNAQGELVGISRLVRDISGQLMQQEARATVARLAAENQQILEASRLKSAFLANMSHELRTPLNAIIGFADLLKGGFVPAAAERYEEFVGYISSSGKHLLQVINDILDLSKVEAGKMELWPEPLDLQQITSEAVSLLRADAVIKGVELRIDVDDQLTDVVLDRARLKQVLYNYLSNALKFTPTGGLVTVRARAQDEHTWRLEVQDTGTGIAEHDLPRLFVDFQQLEAGYTKRHQGTGLGLALTKRMVEAQGGSVGVHSLLGQGSLFYAVLPRGGVPVPSPSQES
jgi:PAS domain S-box-containing protein